MDPGSRPTRQNVVQGRFPKAGPAEPEDVPTAQEPPTDHPPAPAAEPDVRAARRLTRLAAECGWLVYLAVAIPAAMISVLFTGGGTGFGSLADAVVALSGIVILAVGLWFLRPRAATA